MERFPLGRREPVTEAEAAELARRYKGGDAAALEALHDKLGPIILSVLRPYRSAELPSTVAYQDVAQQTWIILAELVMRWEPRGSFLAYFFKSFPRATHRFVKRVDWRGRSRVTRVISVPYEELVREADRLHEVDERSGDVIWGHEVAALPPRERAALLLRVIEGRDFATIGNLLGVSRASAHRLYQRAVASAQRVIADGSAPDSVVSTTAPRKTK